MITIQERLTFPFYVVEAVSAIKEYLHINENVDDILRLADRVDADGIEIYEDALEDVINDIVEIPAVLNAINTGDRDIIEKAILIMVDKLSENSLKNIEIYSTLSQVIESIEKKLSIRFRENAEVLLFDVVNGNLSKAHRLDRVPNYSEKIILALTALELALKEQNPNINQKELNKVLRILGATAYEVDSFGEAVLEDEDNVEFVDEAADLGSKNRKVVRNGKIVTIKKRKKKMNAATRNKISRAMKKVKRKIKPSTIKKMLKSRAIRAKRGL